MSKWSNTNVYKALSGNLATAQERDFESHVLSLLKLIWPEMVQPPIRKIWDRKGIDLFVWSDTGAFPCVVQCKGFHVQHLDVAQRRQVLDSIVTFHQSGVKVGTYILAHNRDHRNPKFLEGIQAALDELVADGIAHHAYIWDRRQILDQVFDAMQHTLELRIRESARELLQRRQHIFDFSRHFVTDVPFAVSQLIFTPYEPCKIQSDDKPLQLVADAMIPSYEHHRWSIVTGIAGSGKTTALLHAAAESADYSMLFVQAADLRNEDALQHGTRKLLEEIIQAVTLIEDLDDLDRDTHLRIASAALGKLLRVPDSRFILIVDGLDENRIYCDLHGLQMLNNQLADFRCPIILSTRTEHFSTLFGDFSLAFGELGAGKLRSSLAAKWIQLDKWSTTTVLQLIDRVQRSVNNAQRARLIELSLLIQNGHYTQIYGDIPLNPLFLHFLLEDIIENGVRPTHRVNLIERWAQRKIRRDRLSHERINVSDGIDIEEVIDRMLDLMGHIAFQLIEQSLEMNVLTEAVDADKVNELSQKSFGVPGNLVLPILLNSFLVPVSVRRGRQLNLSFSLRILQEFFLARHLYHHGIASNRYPDAIQKFVAEFQSISEY